MKLDPKGLEAAREQPGTNHDGIIRAYLTALTPAEVGGLVDTLRSMSHDDNTRACVSVNITVSNDLAKKLFDVLHAAPKAATALEAQAAELAAVKEMYAREGAKALYELERAERAEAQLAEAKKALDALLDLNDNGGPFGGELYQDRVDRAWEAARRVRDGGQADG